jgi:putative membrane protein
VREYIFLFLKGVAMGAADVVPGVSGGTIAFISGIYERLLDAIRSANGTALKLLFSGRIKELWQHIDGTFLVVLFAGIGTSVLGLSKLILYLLANQPEMLWSFFFGLIIASALLVAKSVKQWNIAAIVALMAGAAVAYWVTIAVPVETPTDLWFIFLSGAIAICAMILPGISGSFILLLMSKYEYIIRSLTELNFKVIITFALGCVAGLLSFSHVLHWLLKRYHDLAVALLMGFMLGSLNKVWPWKQVLEYYTDRHGKLKPIVETNVWPTQYLELTGKEPVLAACIALCIVGFAVVYLIEKAASQKQG